jgi:PAS domain S-box-containing protein
MDIRLSGPMDGIEATERIRADFDIPVIYLTAHTDRETQQRARHTAPYGYLVKPFDERTLQTTIDMAIERHRHDRRSRANEQRLMTTLTSIGDAVVLTDVDGRITFLNPVAQALLRCSASTAIGRLVDDMMPLLDAETRVPIQHPIRTVLRNGKSAALPAEMILIAQDATEICIDDSVAPIQALTGQIEGVAMVFRDVTMRQQLAQAKQYERLRVLAGGIAHDLNNLLTVVKSNAELAQLDIHEPAAVQESLAQIETAAHRAADLTRHLLAYAGRTSILLEPVDLNMLVEETVGLLSSGPLKAITVRKKLWPNLPRFEADTAQLQQVVQNLLINAAEAIGDRDGTVTVTTAIRHIATADLSSRPLGTELRSGPYVALEIADTGCGMDAATCDRIFEPFFTTKFTGRGLGLAAVLAVIREHRGTISVTSAPNQGTTLTILLPYAPGGKLAVASQPAPQTTWQAHGTVLVVDDEANVRSAIAQLLERMGFHVLSAPDGSYALGVFHSHLNAIDCVLLDLTMPGMPGAEVARAMRELHPTLPIVLMSGYGVGDIAQSIQEVTRMLFLSKPFQFADLLQILQPVLAPAELSCELGR